MNEVELLVHGREVTLEQQKAVHARVIWYVPCRLYTYSCVVSALNVPSISEIQLFVYACEGDSVTLQCNESSTINVIEGRHGMYVDPCDSECCEPNQFDCTQVMEQNNATEWQALKVCPYA